MDNRTRPEEDGLLDAPRFCPRSRPSPESAVNTTCEDMPDLHDLAPSPSWLRWAATPWVEDPSELLAEHRALAVKTFSSEGVTPAEARRLAYVRWQLDRIEASKLDERFGHLEQLAALSERVAAEVAAFRRAVASLGDRDAPAG